MEVWAERSILLAQEAYSSPASRAYCQVVADLIGVGSPAAGAACCMPASAPVVPGLPAL